jgi:hypothetical protein
MGGREAWPSWEIEKREGVDVGEVVVTIEGGGGSMGCPLISEFIPNDATMRQDLVEGGGKAKSNASEEEGAGVEIEVGEGEHAAEAREGGAAEAVEHGEEDLGIGFGVEG